MSKTRDIIQTIETKKSELALVLPKDLEIDRFMRIVTVAINKTPKLKTCDPTSVLCSIMAACQIGLEPNTPEQLCFLIPRKSICNLEMGYRGFLKLAWRSGQVRAIRPHRRFQNDQFTICFGTNEHIEHSPADGDRGEMIGAYTFLETTSGGTMLRYMSKQEIESCRPEHWQKSPSWGSPNIFVVGEMWLKTTIKRLFKYAPLSSAIRKAVAYDDATEIGAPLNLLDMKQAATQQEKGEE